MLTTTFTDLVGCQVPIQQAGMGGVATPELAAAVADAGGLGMVSMVLQPADAVAAGLDALAKQTRGEVGINFLMPFSIPRRWTLRRAGCGSPKLSRPYCWTSHKESSSLRFSPSRNQRSYTCRPE